MNASSDRTDVPAAYGFRMPAEWEPHACTWLSWPHEESDWPGKFAIIPWVYTEIVKALTRYEPVHILVPPGDGGGAVSQYLEKGGVDLACVSLWPLETDRSWVRDSGPIFVVNEKREKVILDWHFNAWAKYDNWTKDDRIPHYIAELRQLDRRQPRHGEWRVVLEGGSIDTNGQGLMLTTEECLLSTTQQRNLPLDRHDYERVFAEYLGVKKVLWLDRGIAGDDTHGHVDDLARFVNPRMIVTVLEDNPADANYELLHENRERLQDFTDLDGGRLEIVTLPMPRPIVFDGMRLPASYANFYIANGTVIVPTFNDPADRVVLGTLSEVLPNHEVVGIHCVDLVWGLGTLHCMTQQEPDASP